MKQNLAKEFFFQIISLLVAIIIIHATYVAVIRPQASSILEEQRELQTEGIAYDMEKSLFVTIKDYEQEIYLDQQQKDLQAHWRGTLLPVKS